MGADRNAEISRKGATGVLKILERVLAMLAMNCFTFNAPVQADWYLYRSSRDFGKSLTSASVVQLNLVLSDFQLSSG